MSTIKGIFEPFYSYVSNQLIDRKILLSNKNTIPSSRKEYDNSNNDFNLGEGIRNQRAFHAYTTEKQCVIRMASGVDVREKNNLLDKFETHLTGPELARNWVLEGGIKHTKVSIHPTTVKNIDQTHKMVLVWFPLQASQTQL